MRPKLKDPFNRRTAARLRAIINAQRVNLNDMADKTGTTRGYIDVRLRLLTPINLTDLKSFGNYLGYTPDELLADDFTLRVPLDPAMGAVTLEPTKGGTRA